MHAKIQNILTLIEEARKEGLLNNDAARVASVGLSLTGDEAMLANRVLVQGADPASLEFLAKGKISDHIKMAHRFGPGQLTGRERSDWLFLANLSADESKESSLRDRVLRFINSVEVVTSTEYDSLEYRDRVGEEAGKIDRLPFVMAVVGGREMRLYDTDLGFAAAYWSGQEFAAVKGVYNGAPYIAVGSKRQALQDLEISVDKTLSPTFGIIEKKERVDRILGL